MIPSSGLAGKVGTYLGTEEDREPKGTERFSFAAASRHHTLRGLVPHPDVAHVGAE